VRTLLNEVQTSSEIAGEGIVPEQPQFIGALGAALLLGK
jgi:activator of 2-hydroxyglutaryl-CoA dehydratase